MSYTVVGHRHRSLIATGVLVLIAALALLVATASVARADGADSCVSGTGYKVCDTGGDDGSSLGSAVVSRGDEDLPATGSSPVRSVVIGAAFIVVGSAAVAGSLRARSNARSRS